jgi:hypothetical protein
MRISATDCRTLLELQVIGSQVAGLQVTGLHVTVAIG